MNRSLSALTALLVLSSAGALVAGPLTPPAGPVASTGKTLTEVEPRIAISQANTPGDADATPSTFKITQPGSYYLTGNITGEAGKHGIEIAALGVTLDLNGFAVTGVPTSLSGVYLRSSGTEVRNGIVRNWGANGIGVEGASNRNRVIDVRAFNNTGVGIDVGNYGDIRNCMAASNGSHGVEIYAFGRAEGCTAQGNGGDGVHAGNSGNVVINCVAAGNVLNGISVATSNSVIGCSAYGNTKSGIDADFSVVRECTANGNNEFGFLLGAASTATGNRATGNDFGGFTAGASCMLESNLATSNGNGIAGRSGFTINGAGIRATNNHAVSNPIGFLVSTGPSVLMGNSAMSGTVGFQVFANTNTLLTGNIAAANSSNNFAIGASNDSGAIITNPGVGFATTNPAANYAP